VYDCDCPAPLGPGATATTHSTTVAHSKENCVPSVSGPTQVIFRPGQDSHHSKRTCSLFACVSSCVNPHEFRCVGPAINIPALVLQIVERPTQFVWMRLRSPELTPVVGADGSGVQAALLVEGQGIV
jgi:hypothetical protein